MTAVRSVKTSAPLQGGAENCPGLCSKLHFNPQSAPPDLSEMTCEAQGGSEDADIPSGFITTQL